MKVLCVATLLLGATIVFSQDHGVLLTTGTFKSPTGQCSAKVSVSSIGGHKMLELSNSIQVADVSGLAWESGSQLVYSVSPIYGKPGIYHYDCRVQKSTRIVAPKNVNSHYPAGADYFELKAIDSTGLIRFYYAADVDELDFTKFRTARFLYMVKPDGSGMRAVGSNR